MDIISQRDQLFQAAQNLTFDDLKQLCQTNRDYRTLCAEPRFQQLIRNRFEETTVAKVRKVLQQIKDTPNNTTLLFQLVPVDTANTITHELDIYKDDEGKIAHIQETIAGFPMEKSLIYQLFKKLMKFKGIENYTPSEYRRVAELMYQDEANEFTQYGIEPDPRRLTPVDTYINRPYGKYLLLNRLMIRYNNLPINLKTSDEDDEHRSIDVEYLSRENDARYTINYPTDSDLREVFTQMIEQYPNYSLRTV